MKFTFPRFILLFSVVVLLSSCLDTTSDTTTVYTPYFSSLVFKTNDSIPALSTAVFTKEYDPTVINDSVIINVDSLPYTTRVDSVYPTFGFKSSYAAKLYFPDGYKYKKDSAWITGSDTIDFRKPIRVRNYAADLNSLRDYIVRVNVHKIAPELYVWKKVNDGICSIDGATQKAVIFNGTFFLYMNTGVRNYLYTSSNGYSWGSSSVTGLPDYNPMRYMVQFNSMLFLTDDIGSNVYYTRDGYEWKTASFSAQNYIFKALLYELDGKIWAITQSKDDQTYRFASSEDGFTWVIRGEIPAGFPVGDFAATSFYSKTGKEKSIVVGGYSSAGDLLKNRWSTEDGQYWINFSSENTCLDSLEAGASIISYDKKLLVFGDKYKNGELQHNYMVSKDDGLTWQVPDTLYNRLRQVVVSSSSDTTYINYEPRSYQSVVVNKADATNKSFDANRIFVIGGKAHSTIFFDVWTAKLNRLGFLRQDD